MRVRLVLGLFVAVLIGCAAHVETAEAGARNLPEIADGVFPGFPHLPPPDEGQWLLQLIRYLRRYWHPYKAGLPEIPPLQPPGRAYTPHMHRGKLDLAPSEPTSRCQFVRGVR